MKIWSNSAHYAAQKTTILAKKNKKKKNNNKNKNKNKNSGDSETLHAQGKNDEALFSQC